MKLPQFLLFIFSSVLILYAANNPSSPVEMQDKNDGLKPFNPSDGIKIDTFPDTAFFLHGKIFPIDDRGYAEFPILGKIKISEMSESELSDFLKTSFKIYLKMPTIKIKPLVRISLLGGFTRPGLYYVDIDQSLWEVVHLAGGTLNENGIDDMRWERNDEEESDEIINYFEKGVSLRNMGFKSGDQIWTPSPNAPTLLSQFNEILPILTFATTIWYLYTTFQRDQLYYSRSR